MTDDRPRYQIVIDCLDLSTMVRFWAEALGYVPEPPPNGHGSWRDYWLSVGVDEDVLGDHGDSDHDSIVDPTGRGPRVWFQQVPEHKTIKNRLHFDLVVGGGRALPLEERIRRVDTEVERLTALGATVIARTHSPEYDHYFVAMCDLEGNEFDVV